MIYATGVSKRMKTEAVRLEGICFAVILSLYRFGNTRFGPGKTL